MHVGKDAAFEFTDAAPVEVGGVAVLLVAGYDAALAADALRHVEMKAILFTDAGRARRDELQQIAAAKQR